MRDIIFHFPHLLVYHAYRLLFPKRYSVQQARRTKPATKEEYSLQGFDRFKCIFVHVPKAAGVSLANNLFGDLGGGHVPIYRYYLIYSPEEFKRYYKFTIVRNPWDRLVSAYFFLKQGGFNDVDRKWFQDNISKYDDFDSFVKGWVTRSNVNRFIHFVPQHKFIMLGKEILVDKVYKFEDMGWALSDLSERLSIRLKNNHANKTKIRESDYSQYYTEESRSIVERVYLKDIEIFGYNF